MKVVYSDAKTGKTAQIEVQKEMEHALIGKKIGDEIEGGSVDASLNGIKLKITGLSDKMGAPSRRDLSGTRKERMLLGSGAGIRPKGKGYRARRMVRGNMISSDTEQVNTVITDAGGVALDGLFKKKAEKKEGE
ncbi:MAG: S6e family ribosomal protein [Candidatus Micrarchaeaceae archaeon]